MRSGEWVKDADIDNTFQKDKVKDADIDNTFKKGKVKDTDVQPYIRKANSSFIMNTT